MVITLEIANAQVHNDVRPAPAVKNNIIKIEGGVKVYQNVISRTSRPELRHMNCFVLQFFIQGGLRVEFGGDISGRRG